MISLKPLPPDEIFGLNKVFIRDARKNKINGGIGVIVGEDSKPFVLPVVKQVIKRMNFDNFNYLPVSGDASFLEKSAELMLGSQLNRRYGEYFAKQGVAGGTNGLFTLGSLITEYEQHPTILLSNPTWENHKKIFSFLQFNILEYNHVDGKQHFDIASLISSLKKNPSTYVLLHGGPTHNPTGINPNKKQWNALIPYIKKGKHQVIFDFAYMGIGNDIDEDSYPIRLFLEKGLPISVIISYSKNMTLYQHRTGALLYFCHSVTEKETTEQHLQRIFRIVNSNPPAFGEQIAKIILENDALKNEWVKELAQTVENLYARRRLFVELAGDTFRHILQEKGLFSLLGLQKKHVEKLRDKYGIYLLSSSRVNFGGISLANIPYLSESISKILNDRN